MALHRSHVAALLMALTLTVCAQSPGGTSPGGTVESGDPCPGKRWGLADTQGNMVVPYQFTNIKSSDNEALAAKNANGLYGILAADGHPVSTFEYESAYPGIDGIILVSKNGLKGVYDHSGKLLLAPLYQSVNSMKNDLIPVMRGGMWGWVDLRNGKSEFPDQKFQYTKALGEDLIVGINPNNGGLTGFHRNGQVRFSIREGDNANPVNDTLFRILEGTQWAYFDFDGKACAEPPPAPLSPFWKRGLWGYKAADGSVKIAPRFRLAEPFQNGLARVHEGQLWGLIRENGDWAIPPAYSLMGPGADGEYVLRQGPNSDSWVETDISGHRSALPGRYCQVLPRLTSGLFPVREP